jgi:hypothetical protein
MVEDPVPSSQPTADGVTTPLPPARVDDTPTPTPPMAPARYTDFHQYAQAHGFTNEQAMSNPTVMRDFVEHLSTYLPGLNSQPTPSDTLNV